MNRLLFVDDEQLVLSALRRTFEAEGFHVVTALGAEDGLRAIESEGPFQLVCSDYRMPGMSGAAFLEEARARDPHAFRVLLTAASEFEVALEAINRGEIQRYVTKPWDKQQLVGLVREACEGYNLQRRYQELTQLVHSKNLELEALNHDLERQVNERTTNLLEGLTAALDYRDSETQWHSRRVAWFTKRIAQQLGVRGQELWDVEQGALLHDVGKIGVRDAILLKPGPLTPEEWVEMRRHPELGFQLLRNIPFLQRARLIVLQHQERWDGQGYPQKLRGRSICLGARIFAIADTLDAITSDRPYRKARSYEEAKAEIRRCAGTQFDPELVEAFCAIPESEFDEIRGGIEQLADEDERRLLRDALAIEHSEVQ